MFKQALYINFNDTHQKEIALVEYLYKREIYFTKREFKFFYYLYMNKNMLVTYNQILDYVWADNYNVSGNIVYIYMGYILKKLQGNDLENCIVKHRSFGYKLVWENKR